MTKRVLFFVAAMLAGLSTWSSVAHANGKGPRKLAFVGLLRGPMAPARAEALEQLLLHEALLAKAEALDQSGKSSAALETLKQLASLSPKKVPTKKTHPPKFVALWERAQKELGSVGRIAIDADEPAPILLLDGKHLGV